MKKSKITKVLMVGALLSSSIAPVMVSAKENDTKGEHKATLGLTEGEFTLQTSASLNFGSHTIEKAKKTVSTGFAGDFFVTDARGTQAGWDLTVSATPFTIVKPKNGWVKENPYSLPLGSLTLDKVKTVTGVYNEKASIYPALSGLGVVIDLGQEVNVSNAVKGHGMGKYKFTFGSDALHLVIDPATAKIDKVNYPDSVTPYEATITWNLVSGPTTGGNVGGNDSGETIDSDNGSDNLNSEGNTSKPVTTKTMTYTMDVGSLGRNIGYTDLQLPGDVVSVESATLSYQGATVSDITVADGRATVKYNPVVEKRLVSGTYTPAQTKTVTVNGNVVNYDVDGFKGTLTPVVISGKAGETIIISEYFYSDMLDYKQYVADGSYWGNYFPSSKPKTVVQNGVTYTGTSYFSSVTRGTSKYNEKGELSQIQLIAYYDAYLKSPDTRVYQSSGVVTKPAVDTRVYNDYYNYGTLTVTYTVKE